MKIAGNRLSAGFGVAILGAALCLGPGGATGAVAPQKEAPHWDYEEHGPSTWSAASPDFVACGEGRSQSPIDIANAVASKEPAIRARYKPASLRIVHNIHTADVVNTGHSIQLNFPEGESLTIGRDTYSLVQMHLHGPSEHTVNGRHFPMEAHLVHVSADKKIAVIAVFVEQGRASKAMEPVVANLPRKRGVEAHLENVTVDLERLVAHGRAAYRYNGSLTTPPCSESVTWIVIKDPVQMSAAQIKAFAAIVWNNNRPVQPLNGRTLYLDEVRAAN